MCRSDAVGIERSWLASAVLTKREVDIVEILMHLGEKLYIRCSLLPLLNRYRPRERSDWLEEEMMRQVTNSPLGSVSRETYRKKGVPMTAGAGVEMEGGTRQARGLSLWGTLEIEP